MADYSLMFKPCPVCGKTPTVIFSGKLVRHALVEIFHDTADETAAEWNRTVDEMPFLFEDRHAVLDEAKNIERKKAEELMERRRRFIEEYGDIIREIVRDEVRAASRSFSIDFREDNGWI